MDINNSFDVNYKMIYYIVECKDIKIFLIKLKCLSGSEDN